MSIKKGKKTVKVVSIFNDKSTAKVVFEKLIQHKTYKKYIKNKSFMLVDCSNCDIKVGQYVDIVSCRPISKNKSWKISLN